MPFSLDVNELFAWVRATSNVDLLRQVQQAVNARVTELQEAQVGGQGAHMIQPHVQPTDEYRAGVLTAQPLVGPSPQSAGPATSLEQQAEINKSTEEGQKASRRLGPQPVAVNTGPPSEQEKQQAKQVVEQQQEQQKEETQREAQQLQQQRQQAQAPQPAAPPPQPKKPQGVKP